MIIDCHAHVFQNWHGACGHPSIDVHLKYIQKNVTRPAAEAFRVRDGMRVKPGMLFRDGDNTWTGLKDVGFRIGRYGRLEFMHEGEEYAIQYMPVGMQTIESPPEFMIAQMLYAGVDHCILQAGGGYGAMNDYNAFTQSQYPGKFTGLLHIDEAVADRAEVLAEADRAHGLGLKGLYYSHDFSRHGYARNLDHDAFRPFWDRIAAWNFPAFVELSATPDYDRKSYTANLMALDRLMLRHPAANNERSVGLFLAMGYHDALLRRLRQGYAVRSQRMAAALSAHLPDATFTTAAGASSYWLRFPAHVDTRTLAAEAAQRGVLIEPGDVFFDAATDEQVPRNYARLGFASIDVSRIEPGIAALAAAYAVAYAPPSMTWNLVLMPILDR